MDDDWRKVDCICSHGIIATMGMLDECPICEGSGFLWIRTNGTPAKYHGGPFVGKAQPSEYENAAPLNEETTDD